MSVTTPGAARALVVGDEHALAAALAQGLGKDGFTVETVGDGPAAVLIAARAIAFTGFLRADAVAPLLIGLLILPRTRKLLRETVGVLMEATPKGVDLAAVRAHIVEVAHVHEVHDLHGSSVTRDLPVLTAHVVVDDSCFTDGRRPALLDELQRCLAGHFDVEHSTFQFEPVGHAALEHGAHSCRTP